MANLIYIADDEKNIRQMMKLFLESEGFAVETFADGAELRRAVRLKTPDMIILDVMMPGEDGFRLCSSFRREYSIPIMIVSAKDTPLDRVTGLTLGSDDYMTKPFLPLEFVARVKALFRRARLSAETAPSQPPATDLYVCGTLRLSKQERQAYVEGEKFQLTPTEFDFLLYLMERQDTAVSKEELLEQIWGFQGTKDNLRMSDDLLKRLRKKMRQAQTTARIETVWGYGYRLTAKPV